MGDTTYNDVRNQIVTGDLIAVKRKGGLFAWMERFFQRSDYTHTGVAIWLDGGLWLAELNGGGNHLVPLSQLGGVDFDVFRCPVESAKVRAAILKRLRVPLHYGFSALPVIGLLDCLRIKVFLHARQILVCSGYCVSIYEAAGWPERSRLISPRELASMLSLRFSVKAQ